VNATYDVRTYGCQMNVHDSERIAGLLEEAGYVKAATDTTPAWSSSTPAPSRERRQRLYGNLGQLVR